MHYNIIWLLTNYKNTEENIFYLYNYSWQTSLNFMSDNQNAILYFPYHWIMKYFNFTFLTVILFSSVSKTHTRQSLCLSFLCCRHCSRHRGHNSEWDKHGSWSWRTWVYWAWHILNRGLLILSVVRLVEGNHRVAFKRRWHLSRTWVSRARLRGANSLVGGWGVRGLVK